MNFRVVFFLVLTAAHILSFPLDAAEERLDRISVIASRTPVAIRNSGSAVTIIDREEIEQSGQAFVSDLLQQVPGVNVSRAGGVGSQTQIRVRGAEANQLLVLIDGVEVNDPAASAEFNFAHLLTADVERIEVLRGPQSALWGSDALAGVINITTRKASNRHQAELSTEYGADNTVQTSGQLGTANEHFNTAIQVSYLDTQGINIASSGHERDGYDNVTASSNAEFKANSSHTLGFNLRYTSATNEFDNQSFTGLSVPEDTKGYLTDVEQLYGAAYWKFDTFSNRIRNKIQFSQADTDSDNEDPFSQSRLRGANQKIAFQSTWMINPAVDQSLTLLAEREREKYKQRYSFADQSQALTDYGAAAEYRHMITSRFGVHLSIRHDDNEKFENHTTYRASGSYTFPEMGTTVYIANATGAKNPTFVEIFGFIPASFVGNPNLEPEKSESWEIGLRQAFFDNAVFVETTFFDEDLKDEIVTVFLPTFESTVVNADQRSKRSGLEFSIDGALDNFAWGFNYTYLKAKGLNAAGDYATEVRRPRHQGSMMLNYRFSKIPANIHFSIDYIGEHRDDVYNNNTFETDRLKLDDYLLANIHFNYAINDSVQVFATLNNIFDEEYEDVTGYETLEFSAYAGLQFKLQ